MPEPVECNYATMLKGEYMTLDEAHLRIKDFEFTPKPIQLDTNKIKEYEFSKVSDMIECSYEVDYRDLEVSLYGKSFRLPVSAFNSDNVPPSYETTQKYLSYAWEVKEAVKVDIKLFHFQYKLRSALYGGAYMDAIVATQNNISRYFVGSSEYTADDFKTILELHPSLDKIKMQLFKISLEESLQDKKDLALKKI